jgi:hypothetical protein
MDRVNFPTQTADLCDQPLDVVADLVLPVPDTHDLAVAVLTVH